MQLLLGDLADPAGKTCDLAEILRRLGRSVAGDQALAVLGIDPHRGERLADFVSQPGGDLAERRQPVGLLQLFAQGGGLRCDRGGGARLTLAPPQERRSRCQPQHPERAHACQPPVGDRDRKPRRRVGQQVQLPPDRRDRLDLLDHPYRAAGLAGGGQFEPLDPRHPETHGIARRIARFVPLSASRRGAEPPVGVAGEQHDPVGIGDEHPVLGIAPAALEPIELDLDRHHPERSLRSANALGKIEPGTAADSAECEFGLRAIAQCARKIVAEAVVRADEAVGPVPVARRQRQAARVHQIDRCSIGLPCQRGEASVDRCALAAIPAKQRSDFGIDRQHPRDEGELVELALQPGGENGGLPLGGIAGFAQGLHPHRAVEPEHGKRGQQQHGDQRHACQIPAPEPALHDPNPPLSHARPCALFRTGRKKFVRTSAQIAGWLRLTL